VGYTIGIDVGGTFTDLVRMDGDGEVRVVKIPSTPDNQANGVVAGLHRIAAAEGVQLSGLLRAADLVIHGSSRAGNCPRREELATPMPGGIARLGVALDKSA
jgi:N-methylhydantoinase A